MRSDARASTAGSDQRRAMKQKPGLLLVCLAACVAALAVVVGSASAAKTHIFKEAFGSAAQPTFTAPRGMAIDQGSGDVYVIDAGSPPSVKRYNADGTPSNFSALSSNAIDGAGGADATPQGSLAFGAANRVQIAIDESGTATDGDIYVAQAAAKLLDVFSSTGEYKGQLTESSEGPFGEICGVAVDSAGALYLGDIAGKIHKYVPAANPPVNADNTANFSTVASPCQIAAGTGPTAGFIFVNRSTGELLKVDASTGESKYAIGSGSHRTVYVNPASGHVYAPRSTGFSAEAVEYDASGAASATTVSSVMPGSTIEGIAVRETSGDVYLTRSGQSTVQVYGPTVTEPDVTSTAATNNTGTHATLNGTVNPDGVELSECFFEWGRIASQGGESVTEHTVPCAESNATIGSGTSPVAVHADLSGLQPNGARYEFRLVAKNATSPAMSGSSQSFTTPNTVVTTAATGITPTEATLNGSVNPDGATISECVFELGPPKGPGESIQQYPESAPCVPGPGSITGTSPVAVHADLSGLHPGTVYHYRLEATYPAGPVRGGDLTVQTAGPAIAASWSEDVVRTEATLKAEINPEGSATSYHFEWGTSTAYGEESPVSSAGSGSATKEVSAFLEGLTPGTTYHWRVVASNANGTNEGPDRTLTTYAPVSLNADCPNQAFRYGPGANLPDCRGYEMVSPIDKNGGDIRSSFGLAVTLRGGYNQAASDGNKLTFTAATPFANAVSARGNNQYMATRGADGWTTHSLNAPRERPVITAEGNVEYDLDNQFRLFTPDLSSAWVRDDGRAPLAAGASQGYPNLYRRDNRDDTYEALTNVTPPGAFTEATEYHLEVEGHSSDFSHVLFAANAPLTPDASPGTEFQQLYDYSNGELHLVSVLPNGTAVPAGRNQDISVAGSLDSEQVTVAFDEHIALFRHAVSDDGSRVFFSVIEGPGASTLYVRENPDEPQSAINGGGECTEPTKACTVRITNGGGTNGHVTFWGASGSGAKVLYSTGDKEMAISEQQLGNGGEAVISLMDVDSGVSTTIAGESSGVLGASEDLSYIYFASREVLAPGATADEQNVYLDHDGAIKFITTVASTDAGGVSAPYLNPHPYSINDSRPIVHAARTTPDGKHIVFQSIRSLTGYDNTDAVSGEPDVEVYLYDADTEQLRCISCNPSGSRPVGKIMQKPYRPSENEPSGGDINGQLVPPTWAAAWIQTEVRSFFPSHVLSDDGRRVYFNSFDALVPQDTNGAQDVYQWEAPGGGSCSEADPTFSPRDGGCISLISSGESSDKSEFVDATPDGSDVFFETTSSLYPLDPSLIDIYDARVGGGFPVPPNPASCSGDACQSAPEPPVEPTPASASFHGAGNPTPKRARSCGAGAKRAAKLRHRARLLRHKARHATSNAQSKALRGRSASLAKKAGGLSKKASRCRRANRRAKR